MAELTGGYQIGDHFFPFAARFKLGDPVLVEELTGLTWNEFLDRLPDEDSADDEMPDPVAMLGLVGVAVWRANPTWRRDRVIRYVQQQEMENVTAIAPDTEDGEDGPPATTEAGLKDSEPPASGSESDSASTSEP